MDRKKSRRLGRLPKAKEIVPVGTTQWYAWVKAGKLPKPIKIGRASFWDLDEVQEAVDRLIEDEVAA